MEKTDEQKYLLVFDTNILYMNHDSKADFTKFMFANSFDIIKGKIESIELNDFVTLAIPDVVWQECKKEYLSKYQIKKSELDKKLKKVIFPGFAYNQEEIDYESYLEKEIERYRFDIIVSSTTDLIELPFPNETCLAVLINKAFNNLPPFSTNNDKGFKDALLWESVLCYKRKNSECGIILYTKDGMFNDTLKDEYINEFSDNNIHFFSDENLLLDFLDDLATRLIEDVYIPEVDYQTQCRQIITDWLKTDEFNQEINRRLDRSTIPQTMLMKECIVRDFYFTDYEDEYNNQGICALLDIKFSDVRNNNIIYPLIQKYDLIISVEDDCPTIIIEKFLYPAEEAKLWVSDLKTRGEWNE